jgi:hypothetical protein
MSNFKTGGPRQLRTGLAAMPLRAAQDHLDQALQQAGRSAWPSMPSAHAQVFQRLAERRRLVFGVRSKRSELAQLSVDGQVLFEIDSVVGFSKPEIAPLPNSLPSSTDLGLPDVLLDEGRLRELLREGDLLAMGGERNGVQNLQVLGVGDRILSLEARRESSEQWSLWQGNRPLSLNAGATDAAYNAGDYELLLLAPLLDCAGPGYADIQLWNAAYRRSVGDSAQRFDPACAELTGRIEMILDALDDDAAGIAPLEHDIRPRPGGLAAQDFPAMLFLPHPVGEYPTQCPIIDRSALHALLCAVHDAGLALDIDPGWRELID